MAMARPADRGGCRPAPEVGRIRRGVVQMDVFLEARGVPGCRCAWRSGWSDPGWHVNPPALVPDDRLPDHAGPKAPVQLGPIAWPLPATKAPAPGEAPIPLLEGTVWIRASLAVPPAAPLGPRKVPVVLSVQPCEAASCRTPVDLAVGGAAASVDAPARHPTLFR
jgi:hypothetical protein